MNAELEPESTPLTDQGISPPRKNTFNVFSLGASFCLLFIAFNTAQSFESTVNQNLGLWSLSALYMSFSVCNLFAHSVVQRLGERICLTMGASCYVLYVGANLYAKYYTLVPGAIVLGFGASVLWTAQGSFLAKNSDSESLGFHSGLFFALFQSNAVVGNLMAALFFHFGKSVHFLFFVLFGVSVVASLSFLLLRNPPNATREVKQISITDTLKLFLERKMQLLLPVLVYSGFSQSYFYSRIPQAMGIKWIGFVMASFGAADTLGSIAMGRISDKIGKKPVLLMATLFGFIGYGLSWFVSTERPWLFFVVMIFLGLSDAGYNTQLYAVMGIFQPNKIESGYAFLKLIQSTTSGIAFFYSLFLTLREIVILISCTLLVAIISFIYCDAMVCKVDSPKPHLIRD